MATVNVKYKYGDKVSIDGVQGHVTAIFIRGRGRAYEFSYVDKDGHPTSCTSEECEMEFSKDSQLGFKQS